jgi:pilus assembly protein Flp/PilA
MFDVLFQVANRVSLVLKSAQGDRRARGQGLVEYALIIALIAVVVIAALLILGPRIASVFNNVSSTL